MLVNFLSRCCTFAELEMLTEKTLTTLYANMFDDKFARFLI